MRPPARPKRFIRPIALSLVVSGGFAVAIASSPAVASTPDVGTFLVSETGVDPGASAACGFTVSFTLSGTGSFQVLFNQAGDPTRVLVHENLGGTFSANGHVVRQAAHTATFYDLAESTQTQVGLVDRIFASGGTLQIEVGRLVFDASDQLIFEAGPHPALHGDFTALCAALPA